MQAKAKAPITLDLAGMVLNGLQVITLAQLIKTCDSAMVEYNDKCFAFTGRHPDGSNGLLVSTDNDGVTHNTHVLRAYGN